MSKPADIAHPFGRRWRPRPGLLLAPVVLLFAWAVAEMVIPHPNTRPPIARMVAH